MLGYLEFGVAVGGSVSGLFFSIQLAQSNRLGKLLSASLIVTLLSLFSDCT